MARTTGSLLPPPGVALSDWALQHLAEQLGAILQGETPAHSLPDGTPWSEYIPHRPTAKQREFLALTGREAFYGGAAGGGKSDALLMGALQYVHVSSYAAILFRRTYADLALPGALMDRAREWLGGTDARWSDKEKTWHFPSGATLTFGYLEAEKDRYRYQSAEFQYIGFDELTQFTETQYRYLFSRLRRLVSSSYVPLRMRAASNPGGAGHGWVNRRFIVEGEAHGRPFIPAMLADNPHLDVEDYEQSLAELDPVTRAQLRRGDWSVKPAGRMFRREWFPVVDDWPRSGRRVRYWDLAATEEETGSDPDYTSGALVAERDGQFWIIDMQRFRASPKGTEDRIKQTAALDGRGVEIWLEQEPGSSGKTVIDHYRRVALKGCAVFGNRATGSKAERTRPVSSAAEAGNIFLVSGAWNGDFLDEAEDFPGSSHDDQVDAVSGAVATLTGGSYIFSPEEIAAAMSDDITPLFDTAPQREEKVQVFSDDVKPLFKGTKV